MSVCKSMGSVSSTYGLGGDVGEIGGNTGGVDNIVEGELIDERAELEEEGQRLNRSCVSD